MTTDPNNPEVVKRVRSEIEAAAIVSALADAGIEAHTTGDFTAGFRAEASGDVNVIVRRADLGQAKKLLDQMEQYRPDRDELPGEIDRADDSS